MSNKAEPDERPSLFGDDEDQERRDPGQEAPPRHFMRRHPLVVALVALLALAGLVVAGFAMFLNAKLGQVDTVEVTRPPENRRPAATGNPQAVNILLAGVDKGDGRSIAEIAAGGWDPGVLRSDTIMVLHLTADRKQAYVVSIPRDSYIRLYDETGQPQRMDKANAAFSLSGPTAYLATVENLTGLRMQHLAVVDWAGFEDITNALGGVEVYVPPATAIDKSGAIKPGRQVLNGEQALRYVRTRYTLPSGDFGRIDRQQNFIRSLMRKLLDRGTLTNPFTLAPTIDAVARNLTVDESLDTGTMRNLALSLRGIRPADVTFVTAPFDSFDRTGSGASIVRLDPAQSRQLWRAVGDDDIESYLTKYGEDSGRLPAPREVD